MEKVMAAWGAGDRCKNYLTNGLKDVIKVIFDNDGQKDGKEIYGIPILHSSKVKDWRPYFIIIISLYEDEIAEQLEGYGLEEERDFISCKKYCGRDVPLCIVQESLRDSLLCKDSGELRVKVYDKREYEAVKKRYGAYGKYEEALSGIYRRMPGKVGGYIGKCAACEEEQVFGVDYVWSDGARPAWRETVTCPQCHCNGRMRFVIDHVKDIGADKSVYAYEFVTDTFRELQKKIPGIQGSEYIGDDCQSGQVIDGIMHQDATRLSFPDDSFDYMISNDVLEHVADFKAALKESYRCLKKNGRLLVSIPIFKDRDRTVVRTKRGPDGNQEYVLPPVYHGNPLSAEGSLVYTEFGWDILESFRKVGFSDVYAIVYFSAEKGYFGDFPVIFEAVK